MLRFVVTYAASFITQFNDINELALRQAGNMDPLHTAEPVNILTPAQTLKEPFWLTIAPPTYKVAKDLIRAGDAALLLAASTLERLPDIQTLFTATSDHNHLMANVVGGCIAFTFLRTADGYKIRVLKRFPKQAKRVFFCVVGGTVGVYLSLTIMHHTQAELIAGPVRCLS